jgi:perosamine synthetase
MSYIYQIRPVIGEEEKQAVVEYLDSGGWLTEYERTREFERAIAQLIRKRYASVVTSGTVSIFLALKALGVGPGDEVIVPDFTMIATANAVLLAGARPVMVDIEPQTLCLDISLAESVVTSRTKAVIVVSINGRCPDMDRAGAFAQAHGLALIEDAAQAMGSTWRGKPIGSFGYAGCFSFSPHKIVTTGQGGAIVTDDEDLIERVRRLKDFGREAPGIDRHVALGFNFKFTDLQAVVGLAQLKKLEERLGRKKELFRLYQEYLRDVPEVSFLSTDLSETVPWFVDILVPDPEALKAHLDAHGIGSRRFYPPVHTQEPYRIDASYPVAEEVSRRGLWLPSSISLDDETIRQVCGVIRAFYKVKTPV